MKPKLRNLSMYEKTTRMYEKSTYIWQRLCAWFIHSTLRLHSLGTTDLYSERSKRRREVPVDISSLWGSLLGESLLSRGRVVIWQLWYDVRALKTDINFSVDRDIPRELYDTYKHMQMKIMKCKLDVLVTFASCTWTHNKEDEKGNTFTKLSRGKNISENNKS